MKSIKCLFIFLLISTCLFSQRTIRFSGTINSNTQWNYDTVYLTGNVFVPDNVTLSITAGTKIVALGYFKIDVKGRLSAIGQANKFIYFTTLDTVRLRDTSTTLGSWNGLHFESITTDNDSSILQYCRVEFGKAVGPTPKSRLGGGIFIDSCSKIRIQNCQIVNNIASRGGAGIQIVNNSSPIIIENLIKNNESVYEGGGIATLENSAPLIQKNVIIENTSFGIRESSGLIFGHGAGAAIYVSSRTNITPKINLNLIANNISVNGAIYESSTFMLVLNNIIVNNFGGGVFHGHGGSASIYANNTICNNSFSSGFESGAPALLLQNNIITGNIPSFPGDEANVNPYRNFWPRTSHNNIGEKSALMGGFNNIDAQTLFVRPTTVAGIAQNGYEADWRLKQGSPEIDAGSIGNNLAAVIGDKDFLGNTRIVGSRIDIGAIEYTPLSTTTVLNDLNVKIYPNPFSGQIWVDVQNQIIDAHYSIFSIDGKLMSRDVLNQGTQLIKTEQFANGTYILTITDKSGKQVFNSKLVKN